MPLHHHLATVVALTALSVTGGIAETIGDVDAGAKLFGQCKGCHQVGPEARNRIGPHLNMLFGRKAGGLEEYRYSPSMRRAGTNGIEWHVDSLSAFLENPRAIASGTRMSYRGLKDEGDRHDLIAYLRVFSDDPSNIPEADPTATATEAAVDPEILAIQGDPEYGAYLSSECTACHRSSGADDGIPSIIWWPEEDFVTAMHAYKNNIREHPVMQMVAGRLSDDEIAALAAYFKDLEE